MKLIIKESKLTKIIFDYFENNPTVYNDCEECTAIHTIYLNFGSKNC